MASSGSDDVAPPSFDEDRLRRTVERIRRVPDRYREFRHTALEATWQHGIDPALLDALTSLGLPHVSDGRQSGHVPSGHVQSNHAGRRYDFLDLANVSISLKLPSPRLLAMRGWCGALRAAANARPISYLVNLVPACPLGPHEGECRFEMTPRMRAQPGFSGPRHGPFSLRRSVPAAVPRGYPELAEITELLRTVEFHLLPDGLRNDVGFLRDEGLADCGLAARYLAEQATARGMRARRSFGLFLSVPYSTNHMWLEVFLSGRWVSFDPHLLNLLTGWEMLPADQWPPYRSIGAVASRLAGEDFVMASHDGETAQVSFPTRIEAGVHCT